MNTYQFQVHAKSCTSADDGYSDGYEVTIKTNAIIPVEQIQKFFKQYESKQVFQEVMAMEAAQGLGVSVEIVGIHAGIKVTSLAP